MLSPTGYRSLPNDWPFTFNVVYQLIIQATSPRGAPKYDICIDCFQKGPF